MRVKPFLTKPASFAIIAALLIGVGCGSVLNPAFLNTLSSGQFPVTPGPAADFVFVRASNETGQQAEFIVTIERSVLVLDDDGAFQIDEDGNFVTRPELQTVRLFTGATGKAADQGVLFSCSESPVTFVGLGENLLPTDAAVFVGGAGAGAQAGFGIPADDLNPLSLTAGNFNCGDTIVFRAIRSIGVTGGVELQSFLLPGSEQPSTFAGPSTFASYQQFLETQIREDEP